MYGTNGDIATFPAINCSVVAAHVTVLCYTMPGAGYDLTWVLFVGNQTSQAPITAYSLPAIANVSVTMGVDPPFRPALPSPQPNLCAHAQTTALL